VRIPTLDDLPRIDIRRLVRDGYLAEGGRKWMGWQVDGELAASVLIAAGSDSIDVFGSAGALRIAAAVQITSVPLTFGPRRYFVCQECGRQCSLLFVPDLICRHCTGLPYLRAQMGVAARRQDRLVRARRALGIDQGGKAIRPRHMRRERWLALWDELWSAERAIAVDGEELAGGVARSQELAMDQVASRVSARRPKAKSSPSRPSPNHDLQTGRL
jgi:hypothetical protein